jgi:Na+-transporting NADH:ubiquinone oxidoreductase subunit B
MKPIRTVLDAVEPMFEKGGKLERLYPLYEAADTFLYTPKDVTSGTTHVRDAIDLKRMMITVVAALIPCILMALFNTGYQANAALAKLGLTEAAGWRGMVLDLLGVGYDPSSLVANLAHGALYFIPVFLVANIAGGIIEVTFAIVRKHEVNEGFLVTGMLFPLTLPPMVPLWQVAVGIIFGVLVAKEMFGGTGKNFLNVALTARAFLYFAYPAEMSGDAVWTAVDGYTGATILGLAAADGMAAVTETFSFTQAALGMVPGSLGETSAIAAALGAGVLIVTGVGSWRIMAATVIGMVATTGGLYALGSDTNPMFSMSPMWHLVVGGFAFGTVYMATDPVSAAMTDTGRWAYGLLIGFMTALIRVINPAFPEGIMLAILFGNVFAPLFDYYVVKANIRKRELRYV